MSEVVHPTSLQTFALVLGFGALGCSGEDEAPAMDGSSGGSAGTGVGEVVTGGASTVTSATTSGVTTGGTAMSAGGPSGSGGTLSSGGVTTGGVSTGGSTTGSADCTNMRPTGTDWDEATCDQWATQTSECSSAWMVDGAYCNESCGRCGSSGAGGATTGSATTGSATTGSATTGVTPSGCTAPEQTVCDNDTGSHCGYTYEYWKDQGTGCMTNHADGFSVEWNNINNLLGRKGLRPGSRNQIVSYAADYQPNGNSYLTIYGWTRNPLVEYYIVDSWGSWRPPGDEGHMGTVSSDGGTYDIYRTQRVNQPSIEGTATFYQYWSVRTEKRTSGAITVANHFDAWEGQGMTMGSLYEVSMCVEGYQSSGTANVTMSMQ